MGDPAREELEKEYRARRKAARDIVAEEFLELGLDLQLTDIGRPALVAAAQWNGRRVCWGWELLSLKYRQNPKRIELAIWFEGAMVALCYGKVSEGRMIARIDRLERDPHNHAVTGFVGQIATRYLDVLALMCGCEQSVIWGPLPALVEFYKDLGFSIEIVNQYGLIGLSKKLVRQSDVRKGYSYGT